MSSSKPKHGTPGPTDNAWPPRPARERRHSPRLSVSFSVLLQLDESGPPVVAEAIDISLGGLRLKCSEPLELFEQLALRVDLPSYKKDGSLELEPLEAIVVVVRRTPEEPSPEVRSYELALAFTYLPDASERAIGRFMLQRLLYDPDAELQR